MDALLSSALSPPNALHRACRGESRRSPAPPALSSSGFSIRRQHNGQWQVRRWRQGQNQPHMFEPDTGALLLEEKLLVKRSPTNWCIKFGVLFLIWVMVLFLWYYWPLQAVRIGFLDFPCRTPGQSVWAFWRLSLVDSRIKAEILGNDTKPRTSVTTCFSAGKTP